MTNLLLSSVCILLLTTSKNIFPLFNSPISHDEKEKQALMHSLGDELKQLDILNFDIDVWKKYIDQLIAHKITVADCIKYLAEQKEQIALEEVLKEWPLCEQQKHRINSALEMLQNNDQNMSPAIIFMDDTIAPKLQELIKKKAKDFGINVPIHVSTTQNPQCIARVARGINEDLEAQEYIILEVNATAAQPENYIEGQFDAVLEHEFTHLKKYHTVSKMMYLWMINHEDLMSPQQSTSFQKWQRAKEAYADRVSQACCKDPQTTVNIFIHLNQEFAVRQQQGQPVNDKSTDPNHPTPLKRLMWAAKIKNLRLLEQEYKQTIESK